MDGAGGLPVVTYLLQQTLRGLCTDSEWVYAVFWRILPRSYPPPKWDTESSVLDWSKGNKRNWILVWEDGFCDFFACARAANESAIASYTSLSPDNGSEDCSDFLQPEIFFKMSHEVYNFGEGLMGKVAADSSHRWVYKEPVETDLQYPPSWQSTLDPHPRTWEAQFKCGIETIAIVAVKEGLIQLGSFRKIAEDLSFVLYLQRKFNYLQSIPGVFATHPLQQIAIRKTFPSSSGSESSYAADYRAREAAMEGAGHHHHQAQQMVGMKRPAENEASMSRCCCGAPSPSCTVDNSSGFCENCLSSHSHSHSHSPSSSANPKSLKTSFDITQRSPASFPVLLPSMSSLQALLSKLPPVTNPPPAPPPPPPYSAPPPPPHIPAAARHAHLLHPPQQCCFHHHPGGCSSLLLNTGSSPHGSRLQDQQQPPLQPPPAPPPPPPPPLPPAPGVARSRDTSSLAPAPPPLPPPRSRDQSPHAAVPLPPPASRHPPHEELVAELPRPGFSQVREGCTAAGAQEGALSMTQEGYNNTKMKGGSTEEYERENLSIYESCYQLREASFLHETNKLPSFFDSFDTSDPASSEYKSYDDFETYNSLLREINS